MIATLLVIVLGFVLYRYQLKIDDLEKQLIEKNNTQKNELTVGTQSTSNVVYIDKVSKNDNDVELSTTNNIKVKINDKIISLPNNVKENQKFENGKLVIEQQNTSTVDLSKIVDNLADAKGKQYSRSGKVDVGTIYNRKEKELYGGIQYNAKAWSIGYYHSFDNSNDLIMFNYKF